MGFLHIYCGEGKGKTTAALGAAVRMAGAGKTVRIIRLLKGENSSELSALKAIPNITVSTCEENFGFVWEMTEEQKKKAAAFHNKLLSEGFSLVREHKADMLVIDEFNAAYELGLLDRELCEEFLLDRQYDAEIILTGRNPAEIFVNSADYVSEIKCIKHPFDKGVKARIGVEL